MTDKKIPEWLLSLENEDMEFIKQFILSSGSLKDIAKFYGVSYPTVRLRLNNLIQKLNIVDQQNESDFVKYIKHLTIEDKISLSDAKKIINLYYTEKKG
ncbi:DUF2089 family protein [Staphylococcus intermedius]|uniref:Protein of uncharacterized function(DUF2089) n=1 Tax=Staphylococcus intermedius NCTC 11048 TaxID=1141106 RepID=A0A380FY60_STAIN|nr:DUF2089 family protein [Staphylococcus intermedius]PCF84085.1 hypothetical protein B4W76_12300 [Staphylococcus intermedius]PCF85031.1 hypothetical protein B4W75_12635 [Staphylococcus intermedius]PNZ49713.1 DUF2089 domain-containing protein [Staphylococcus intermedius NCTC 11048]SUM43829.1 Protein of uncharacterised function(DUF2089) [Staphylococcus intermedius NCTC 11048]